VAERRELKRVSGFTFPVVALAFSPDGKTLAVGHATGPRPPKGTISFYDTATWEKTDDLTDIHKNYVGRLCFSPDGTLLASGSYDGRVKLWEVAGRKLRGELTDHLKRIAGLAFSPDGRQLASTSDDLSIRISDVTQPPLNGPPAEK
jgi:WD40 repeat protein